MPGNTSNRYPAELKARAVRMYHECRPDQVTDWAAMGHVANWSEGLISDRCPKG